MIQNADSGARRPYIIFTFGFDETSGGVLALHTLCERLTARGEVALLWPHNRPIGFWRGCWRDIKDYIRHFKSSNAPDAFGTGPFSPKLARNSDLKNAIIVYPEIIDGNPLQSENVVRWFLHKPGHHTGSINYGQQELYFFYQDAFDDPTINTSPENRLTITFFNPTYIQHDTGVREGTCYLVRKGRDRIADIDLTDGLCVDDLSHAQKVVAFNRFRYLHSYDLYSMYCTYAVICGAIPVVEPLEGVSREQWYPSEADRYGMAYGWDDVTWAVETRRLLLERLANKEFEENTMVDRFIKKTQDFFSSGKISNVK